MPKKSAGWAMALLVMTTAPTPRRAPSDSAFAIQHVTVIDVTTGRRLPDRTVIVRGRRIEAVRPTSQLRLPSTLRTVAGRGRFLVPGFWDMHVHVCNDSATLRTAPALLIANGVTGVRDMAGPLRTVMDWRQATREGQLLGPRAFVAGPLIDGPPPATEGDLLARTPEEGRAAVDSLADAGVDFIKAYEMLRRDVFLAIVAEARRRNLPVACHLPLAVDAFEASDAGVASFEHLRNLELACSSRTDSLRAARTATLDTSRTMPGRALRGRILSEQRSVAIATEDTIRRSSLFRTLGRNHTWQVPTLFLDEVPFTIVDSTAFARLLRAAPYISKDMEDWWHQQRAAFLAAPPAARERAQREARWMRDVIPKLRHADIEILAGSDMPNLLTAPGFSLHEELRALREAGLTNLEVLRSATIAPARFLRATDSLGTIAPGKIADLVLLDADPLEDISNSSKIRAVVADGRLLERRDLDALLEHARRAAR